MRTRIGVVLVAALGALWAALPPAQAAPNRLVAFGTCGQFLGYAKSHAKPFVTTTGIGVSSSPILKATPGVAAPSAAAAVAGNSANAPVEGVDYSGTNDQEVGVDEPDIVKTNGNTLFTAENGELEAVDVTGSKPKLLDTLQLTSGYSNELLLFNDHLLVISRGNSFVEPLPAMPARMFVPVSQNTVLTEIDVSDPSNLKVVQTATIEGGYLDARMIGSTVRIVTSSGLPIELPFVSGTRAANQSVVAHSTVKQWLPTYKVGKHAAQSLVQCRRVFRPVGFSGLGMTTVSTIDLANSLNLVNSTSVMADGSIVYASPTTLYVASQLWADRPLPAEPYQPISGATTEINAFDISNPTTTTYLGSGSVPGYLLDQFSLSDFQGVLRVVSTQSPAWWGSADGTQSYLTTLKASGGKLVQVGQLGGLGQGERVYAVRFVGNDAFVVTFRQVDPLHAIDVSDPANPKLAGELELSGYSSYLQPLGNNLILGIGQDVGTNNEPSGTQLSLFNVSDLAHPTLVAHTSLGQGWSSAESDHHAFLWWPATNLVVVPFGQQAVGMKVTQAGISEIGRIAQLDAKDSTLPTIDRAVVDRDTLLTVSSAGVKSSSLSSLGDLGWAAFPAPQPIPVPSPLPTPSQTSGSVKPVPGPGQVGAGVAASSRHP
ncbi:MAG TPA: beta-propeller domain-containing protein [Gaiellaceae bacterium]|jgi:uncharacterized secreted protein with C-terminal beta-propeller domain